LGTGVLVPLLYSYLPGMDPGYFAAESVAEMNGCLVEWHSVDSGPEIELAALASAAITVIGMTFEVD